MGSIWTVAPETTRLDANWQGHAFWLDVKRQLTEGERRRVAMAGFKGMSGFSQAQQPTRTGESPRETSLDIDWVSQSFTRTLTWVVDWSLSDEKGNKLALRRDTLEALHPGVYEAIEAAINAHVEAMEQEKKAPTGGRKLKAISTS